MGLLRRGFEENEGSRGFTVSQTSVVLACEFGVYLLVLDSSPRYAEADHTWIREMRVDGDNVDGRGCCLADRTKTAIPLMKISFSSFCVCTVDIHFLKPSIQFNVVVNVNETETIVVARRI